MIDLDAKKSFLNYDYSDYAGSSVTHIAYDAHPRMTRFLRDMNKSNDALAQQVIEKEELEYWKNFRKQNGEKPDERLDNIDALYYYFYSIN